MGDLHGGGSRLQALSREPAFGELLQLAGLGEVAISKE
jgi:hypothetical protein